MNPIQFTKEGLEKVKAEHDALVAEKRPKAIDRLGKARAMGDLSENSEYVAAKEELAFLEGRILELEFIIKNAQVVDNDTNNSVVDVGKAIRVKMDDSEDEYFIVGEFEANPLEKKISHTSPIGRALLGKRTGDVVEVKVPAGTIRYTILDIH